MCGERRGEAPRSLPHSRTCYADSVLGLARLLDCCATAVYWLLSPIYACVGSMTWALFILALGGMLLPLLLRPLRLLAESSAPWRRRQRAEAELRAGRPQASPKELQRDLAALYAAHPLPLLLRLWEVAVSLAYFGLIWGSYLGLYRLLSSRAELRGLPLLWLWQHGERPPLYTLLLLAIALALIALCQLAVSLFAGRQPDIRVLGKLVVLLLAGFLPAGLIYYYLLLQGFLPGLLFGLGLLQLYRNRALRRRLRSLR